jgi:hypothetical protein
MAACNVLESPGFEPQCGRDFPDPSTLSPRSTRLSVKWILDHFPVDRAEGVALITHQLLVPGLSVVRLNIYLLYLPDCHVTWRPLPFPYIGLACSQSLTEVGGTGSASSTGHIEALLIL